MRGRGSFPLAARPPAVRFFLFGAGRYSGWRNGVWEFVGASCVRDDPLCCEGSADREEAARKGFLPFSCFAERFTFEKGETRGGGTAPPGPK